MRNRVICRVKEWLLIAIFMLGFSMLSQANGNGPIVTHTVEGEFPEVLEAVRAAIVGKGINIAHSLEAGDMLKRTGEAFGIKKPVYRDAETLEFCSASISHKLAQANPENIVLCPFAISVYVLTDDPGQVRLSYRIPMADENSAGAVQEVVELIESIVADATAW